MKKILFSLALLAAVLPLGAQELIPWERVNIRFDYAWQRSSLLLRSGFLYGHPERSLHASVGYRIGQRWEVGAFATLCGASSRGISTSYHNGVMMQTFSNTSGYELGYGLMGMWHLVPYAKLQRGYPLDLALRLCMQLDENGVEVDFVFWGGASAAYRLGDHVSLLFNVDLGDFLYTRHENLMHNEDYFNIHPRCSVGVQVRL